MGDKFLVHYYALLIFSLTSLLIIVWLLIYLRKLQNEPAEIFRKKGISNEQLAKELGLVAPDLKPHMKIEKDEVLRELALMRNQESIRDRSLSIEEMKQRIKEEGKEGDVFLRRIGIAEFLNNTKVGDVMRTKVVTIDQDALFGELPRKMEENKIRHLPVVNAGYILVGIVTERDLYKIRSPRKLVDGQWYYDESVMNDIILEHVMNKEVFTMHPDDPLGDALLQMVYHQYGCIPVIDEGHRLCGILTRSDVLQIAAKIYCGSE